MRNTNSTLRSRKREASDAIGEVIREGDAAMLRKHIKSFERPLRCAACAALKRSLSMSCDPLLKQLVRVQVSFECFLTVLFDNFITL
jgi:hypothetical protein